MECSDGDSAGDGRVRVFARVRPAGPREEAGLPHAVQLAGDAPQAVRVLVDGDALERAATPGEAAVARAREFVFDGVFPPGATQEDVFEGAGRPVLRECLRGLNGTIFAYGQTGSGKTHSLLHQGRHVDDTGLLPRLITCLFDHIAQDSACLYKVEAAALQVYNEQVDDLLHPDHHADSGHNLAVQNGGVVPGLTWIRCSQPEQLRSAFSRARSNIVYAETRMNKASSRSHAVFQIRLTKHQETSAQSVECTCARLSVVDLAGSERVKKSGVEGVHFKEATAINTSLLALGNVVSALAAKKAHVPFRDSKLTRILDGCIGGNCKTALLVCASPAMQHAQETLSSLEFASRAMQIQVNARVNCIVEVDQKAVLADLRERDDEKWRVAAEAQAEEAASAQRAVAEAEAKTEHAEARAASAEQEAAEWRERAVAAEAALETTRRTAGERDAELAACAEELKRHVEALDEARAALEQSRLEAGAREAELRRELDAALEVGRQAQAAVAVAEMRVEGARAAAAAQAHAVETQEARAARKATLLEEERGALLEERRRCGTEFDAAVQAQRAEFEAEVRADWEGTRATMSKLRRRGEKELSLRINLLECKKTDTEHMLDQDQRMEEQRSQLCHLITEVEGLRRKLGPVSRQPAGRRHHRLPALSAEPRKPLQGASTARLETAHTTRSRTPR